MTQRQSTLILARVIYYCARGIIAAIRGNDEALCRLGVEDAWEEIAAIEQQMGDELRGVES